MKKLKYYRGRKLPEVSKHFKLVFRIADRKISGWGLHLADDKSLHLVFMYREASAIHHEYRVVGAYFHRNLNHADIPERLLFLLEKFLALDPENDTVVFGLDKESYDRFTPQEAQMFSGLSPVINWDNFPIHLP